MYCRYIDNRGALVNPTNGRRGKVTIQNLPIQSGLNNLVVIISKNYRVTKLNMAVYLEKLGTPSICCVVCGRASRCPADENTFWFVIVFYLHF